MLIYYYHPLTSTKAYISPCPTFVCCKHALEVELLVAGPKVYQREPEVYREELEGSEGLEVHREELEGLEGPDIHREELEELMRARGAGGTSVKGMNDSHG